MKVDVLTLWRPSIQDRFDAWLRTADGQTVYRECRDRALRLRARGWQHFSIDAIWHSVRFDRAVQVGPDESGRKVNDHFTSRMARLLMDTHPELADFFEVRELRAR